MLAKRLTACRWGGKLGERRDEVVRILAKIVIKALFEDAGERLKVASVASVVSLHPVFAAAEEVGIEAGFVRQTLVLQRHLIADCSP